MVDHQLGKVANQHMLEQRENLEMVLKQVAIDLMLGQVQPDEALAVLAGVQKDINEDSEEVILQTADRVRQVANLSILMTFKLTEIFGTLLGD